MTCDQFRRSPVRKISIGVASPSHIDRVDRGPAASVTSSFKDMAEAYEAPKITIEMSMGSKKGSLAETVKGIVNYFRDQAVHDAAHVTKMRAKIKPDGERPENIDLLEDILSIRQNLQLSDNDPDVNYKVKLRALREAMHEWI
jgi:hypothetical protein